MHSSKKIIYIVESTNRNLESSLLGLKYSVGSIQERTFILNDTKENSELIKIFFNSTLLG